MVCDMHFIYRSHCTGFHDMSTGNDCLFSIAYAFLFQFSYKSCATCRLTRLGQLCNSTGVNRLKSWVDLWDDADEDVVEPTGPHVPMLFHTYLTWYLPQTRSRIEFVESQPQPHIASLQDAYAYHRDEALAGAVSFLCHNAIDGQL